MNNLEETLKQCVEHNGLEVTCENIASASKEEFAKLRCNGFGASDSALLLDISPFGTRTNLVKEKADMSINEEISKKSSVRMGRDLEPIILNKAEELLKKLVYTDKAIVYKPTNMYGDKNTHLNINFDGVLFLDEETPYTIVEAKAVTMYGKKYYKTDKAYIATKNGEVEDIIDRIGLQDKEKPDVPKINKINLKEMCTKLAEYYGIPIYYFTQVQQQLMALNAEYGYLATLLVDTWEMYIYKIYRNDDIIDILKQESKKNWAMVEAMRNFKK